MAQEMVLIDTCIWAEFFTLKHSSTRDVVTNLLRWDRAGLIGPVLAEILMGIKREEHADCYVAATHPIRC
jgi:hypothetical protein